MTTNLVLENTRVGDTTQTITEEAQGREVLIGDWERYYQHTGPDLKAVFTAESFHNPTRDGVGAASTESLLLRPFYPHDHEEDRSPIVLFIHGGPHSAVISEFGELTVPVLMACEVSTKD